MEESVNTHHSYGLCLMFIVAITPSTILQAMWRPAQNCLDGSEMLSFLQYRPEDSTVEVSKTTALLFFSTVLDL